MGLTNFVFEEVITTLVKGALEDYAKGVLKGVIGETVIAAQPSVMGQAVSKALREFLEIVQDELESCACPPIEIRDYYQVPISQFIKDDQVKALLGKPFEEKPIEAEILKKVWERKKFRQMPDEFSWEDVANRYGKKVKVIIKTTPELREVFDSNNIEETARVLKGSLRVPPGFNLEKYRESIQECYGYLKLNVLDSTDQQYRLRLWKMFIPQLVREALPPSRYDMPKEIQQELETLEHSETNFPSKFLEQYSENYLQQPIYPVLQLLLDEKYQHVVILGDPGSGKSTLLQWLALQWAEEPTEQLPLLIELREYTRDRAKPTSFLEFFHQGTRTIYKLNQLDLDQQLRSGFALVMFDALDEVVNPDDRQALVTEIINFSNEYNKVKIIITSRIIGYNAEYLRAAEFRHLTLQDLNQSQIWSFIDKWYELALGSDPEREKLAVRLKDAIENSSAITELARSPLLLTMMAILNRRQELPRDRSELYDQASRVLLYNWDVDYKRLQIPAEALGRPEKQAMLRQIAYEMQSSKQGIKGNIIDGERLLKIITQFLEELEFEQPYQKAQSLIEQLRQRNFILCHLGNDYYGFVHRTFLEYFCACEIVNCFEKQRTLTEEELKTNVFGEHWRDKSWHEVLRLITGMLGETVAASMLDYLIEQEDETQSYTNLILAAQCLSEIRTQIQLKQTVTKLLQLLQQAARNDLAPIIASPVINAIAQAWKAEPDILDWLKSRALNGSESFVKQASVQMIAKFWRDTPSTLPWLKSIVQSDQESLVRLTAMYEVSDRWKTDTETLVWLKLLAQSELDADIRGEAVKEVARNWKDNPNTLPWIKSIAIDSAISLAISEAVLQGWEDDPYALSWLWDFSESVVSPTTRLVIRRRLYPIRNRSNVSIAISRQKDSMEA